MKLLLLLFLVPSLGAVEPPTIFPQATTTHPVAEGSAFVGQKVVFTVTATGSQPFTYAWAHNYLELPNSNSDTFVIPAAQLSDSGTWVALVKNDGGLTTSNAAVLTVVDLPPVPPLPTASPTPAPTATPTPFPTTTPTLAPSATPNPTATPKPTSTPLPTVTPFPTRTPFPAHLPVFEYCTSWAGAWYRVGSTVRISWKANYALSCSVADSPLNPATVVVNGSSLPPMGSLSVTLPRAGLYVFLVTATNSTGQSVTAKCPINVY